MSYSRRKFGAILVGTGLALGEAGRRVLAHFESLGSAELSARRDDAVVGYPVRLIDRKPHAAWSAAPGDTIHFALTATKAGAQRLRMLSVGGREVHDFGAVFIPSQSFTSDAPWLNGAGYQPTVEWQIPADLASGVYFLNGAPELFVIVRTMGEQEPTSAAISALPTAVLIPTNTINAYSVTLGRSCYNQPKRVPIVSFQRPMGASRAQQWIETAKWLDAEPLLLGARYISDYDLEDPAALKGIKMLIVAGHSEYWSRTARERFDAFVRDGGNALIASGNAMYWQIRYEEDGERLVAYKFLNPEYGKDPATDPLLVTTEWHRPGLHMPTVDSIGGDFIHGGFGSRRRGLGVTGTGLRVADPRHPLFSGQDLAPCAVLDFCGVLEYDGAPIKGLDATGLPVADPSVMNAYRLEIIAYEWGQRGGSTLATAHVYQRERDGGVVLHLGSPEATDRVSAAGCVVMRAVAREFARRLIAGETVFSARPPADVVYPMHTPWKGHIPRLDDHCGPPPSTAAAPNSAAPLEVIGLR